MTTAALPEPKPHEPEGNGQFDPDAYRMTVGEHLEELRHRLVLALVGWVLAFIGCFIFSDRVITFFLKPLIDVLVKYDLNPMVVTGEVGDGFMVAIRISIITAAAIAGPWMLYQAWQFVAAGLYPHERKYVTRYLPLSLALLVVGMAFVYLLVLPWTLDFFIRYTTTIGLSKDRGATVQPVDGAGEWAGSRAPVIAGDPPNPPEGAIWINSKEHVVKIEFGGSPRVLSFRSDTMIAPEIELDSYINLVVMMLLTFGLSFQLPLVVLALERIGIVEVEGLRSSRRYVYFAMVIAAAIITPGDVITATLALMLPLIGLYELGIWLAVFGRKPDPARPA